MVGRGARSAGRATTSRTSLSTSARITGRPDDARAMDAIGGDEPFMMMADGRAWLYTPSGCSTDPLPTFYEPIESPVPNLLYPKRNANPVAIRWQRPENPYHRNADPRYPLVATTFRLTEHHTAGGMSRTVPWLVELQPEMFAEIDPQLAADRGIEDGGWMTIVTERAEIEARAKVTDRMRPAAGRRARDPPDRAAVALGLQRAHRAVTRINDLASSRPTRTSRSRTTKAFTCDVRAGRRAGTRVPRACAGAALAGHRIGPSEDDPVAENPQEAHE